MYVSFILYTYKLYQMKKLTNFVLILLGASKAQQIGLFDQPKRFEKGSVIKNEEATTYLEKHAALLDEILSKHPVSSAFNEPQARVHKDSAALYHENGQPIFDEINYE